MSNTVKLKRSAVASKVPATTDLALGELALNTYDGNLFFKKSVSGTDSIVAVATLNGSQTLTNKTLSGATLTGTLSAGGNTGSQGQFLKSTGAGVAWATIPGGTLASLGDVVLSSPTSSQVLTFNGTNWINADSNAQIASTVFASSAYDMGFVYDDFVVSEDEGLVTGSNAYVYDLGILSFTGIISLNNLDQSVKSDYLGYSIIFGF
jgi:hypothetical protein